MREILVNDLPAALKQEILRDPKSKEKEIYRQQLEGVNEEKVLWCK